MSIKSVEIKNFKSIEYLKLNISELNAFIGKNGAGKSNVLQAIKYFQENLVDINANNTNFDSNNKYKNTIEITIEYDFSRISEISRDPFSMKLYSMLKFSSDSYYVKLVQKKNESINWNIDYADRYVVYNTHPIYFCDTRSLSLTNWDEIWSVVGDLVNARDANAISKELVSILKEEHFSKFNQYTELFGQFLDNNDLSISENSKKEKIIALLQLQLGGKEFISKDESLEFYSDGTNSQSYILFLSYIAYEISRKRLKDVTILLDEPELGLHPKMVDDLMEKIVIYSNNVKFMIFSHSPRLVSYVLNNRGDLYNVKIQTQYTKVNKVNGPTEEKHKLSITESEAACFFSDFLLFVEGVTEVELFSNKIILELFPFLKKVDVISTDSNDHILKTFSPHKNNSGVPFLILNDLDKFISFVPCSIKNDKFKYKIVGLWYSPLKNEEIDKRMKFNYARPEIKKNLKKKKYIYDSKQERFDKEGYLRIENFESIFESIKSFCLFHNVYVVRDTIEGVIINNNNSKIINSWRKSEKRESKELKKLFKSSSVAERVVINRLLFSGKTDLLFNYNEKKFPEKYRVISRHKIKKNTYWITNFLNYYKDTILNQKQYSKDYSNIKKIERFAKDFPELYDIIMHIKSKISDE